MKKLLYIGENNWEVQTIVIADGNEIVIDSKSYGSDRIASMMSLSQNQITEWTNKDMEAYRASRIAEHQDKLDVLEALSALDAETPVVYLDDNNEVMEM